MINETAARLVAALTDAIPLARALGVHAVMVDHLRGVAHVGVSIHGELDPDLLQIGAVVAGVARGVPHG